MMETPQSSPASLSMYLKCMCWDLYCYAPLSLCSCSLGRASSVTYYLWVEFLISMIILCYFPLDSWNAVSRTELRLSGQELINIEKTIGITSCVLWAMYACLQCSKPQRWKRSLDEMVIIAILDYVVAAASLQIWIWCWPNVCVSEYCGSMFNATFIAK